MQFFDQLPRELDCSGCALTIGTFDGVHRGHASLIQTLREEAARRGLPSAVLTFEDMPYCYFKPDECSRLLTLPNEKRAALKSLAIDTLFLVPFDASIAERSADDFVRDVLVRRIGLKLLVVGPDFALGKDRDGDVCALQRLGRECGFEVVVLREKLLDDTRPISSTRIRECVESGDVAQAARLLGRPFELSGTVVSGRQLGRTIGVPTINLQLHARKVTPSNGVYAVRAIFDEDMSHMSTHAAQNTVHRAALNIGTRPTVNGENTSIEFHVIGEEIPIPPRSARLQLIERLRDERKFPDLPSLVAQMRSDIARATSILDG